MNKINKRLEVLEAQQPDSHPIVWIVPIGEPMPSWAGDPHVFVIFHEIVESPRAKEGV